MPNTVATRQGTPHLERPSLFCERCYIDGTWCAAESGATLGVTDPATGVVIGSVPRMAREETRRAVTAAAAALPAWRTKTGQERGALLRRWHELILAHLDDLAQLLTAEQGKPLAEARGEVAFGASFVEWYAEEARRVYGEVIPSPHQGRRLFVLKQPVGVCGAITPWNFPSAMVTRKVAPALAAGCTVVLKPASHTPYSALALAALAEEAGLPGGVLNILTGPADAIAGELTANPGVRKITFTGSTDVGRRLMRQSADTVKKISLELGGNAAFLVFDDADLDAAVQGALLSKYRNAGQTCVCANRFFVQERIYDAFAAEYAARVERLKVGPGIEPDVQVGPLIDEAAVRKVEEHVADATAQGARVTAGGRRHPRGGLFFEPTVLTNATPTMRIFREETFGPVAPLIRFRTEAEALALANDSELGLASYFYTRDVGRVHRVAEGLETGIVGVNTGIITSEAAPFGGVKQSGLGREGGRYGIEEFLEVKYVCVAGLGDN